MVKRITESIIVQKDVATVYKLWSNFEHFPHFMTYVESVNNSGETSQWTVVGPLGRLITWEAEITRQERDKRIAWSSKDNEGTITTSGQVTFNPLSAEETEVTVVLQVNPPAGKLGEAVANLFNQPSKQLEEDLRHFKQYAEEMFDRIQAS